jgi:hypothetical protein
VTGKQLHNLEHGYLRALGCVDLYRLQGWRESLSVGQFAACEGLDWNEYEELKEHLDRKGIEA